MDRISALIAYIPVIGWLYVLIFQRNSELPMFHVRQSIGLYGFMALLLAGWFVLFWVAAWAPYGVLVSVILFTLVLAAFLFGVVALIIGVVNAVLGKMALLPIVGGSANRLSL
jgi:uncharacterized membrane protein